MTRRIVIAHPVLVDGVERQPGTVLDVDAAAARRLVLAGYAAYADLDLLTPPPTSGTGPVSWFNLLDKPDAFPPSDHTSASVTDFTEAVHTAVAGLLASGTNVTLAYDPTGRRLTVSASGTDAEVVRDAIGMAIVGVGTMTVTPNDAADTITISTTATANATDAALRDRGTHTGSQSADTVTPSATRLWLTPAERAAIANPAASGAGFPSTAADVYFDSPDFPLSGSFKTLPMDKVFTDTGGNYNPTTFIYTVPSTGLYLSLGQVRCPDGSTPFAYGMGVHSDNSDGSWFKWTQTTGGRYVGDYQRLCRFNAGDPVRFYAYSDAGGGPRLFKAALSIVRMA